MSRSFARSPFRLTVLAAALALAGCASSNLASRPQPTEGDHAALARATQQALEETPTGESLNWSNPDSGNRGTVTPTRTWEDETRPCRQYQQTITLPDRTLEAVGKACRQGGGEWATTSHTGFDPVGTVRYSRRYDPWDDPFYDRGPFWRHRYGRWPYRSRFGYPYSRFGYGYPRSRFSFGVFQSF